MIMRFDRGIVIASPAKGRRSNPVKNGKAVLKIMYMNGLTNRLYWIASSCLA